MHSTNQFEPAPRLTKLQQYHQYENNGGTMTIEEWEADGRYDKSYDPEFTGEKRVMDLGLKYLITVKDEYWPEKFGDEWYNLSQQVQQKIQGDEFDAFENCLLTGIDLDKIVCYGSYIIIEPIERRGRYYLRGAELVPLHRPTNKQQKVQVSDTTMMSKD